MRFIWLTLPQVKFGAEGGEFGAVERSAGDQYKLDLKAYFEGVAECEPHNKDFLEKAKKWDESYNVIAMRNAGVDGKTDKNDYLKKHVLLSAAFLEQDSGNPRRFRVNFRGLQAAEYRVGLGDMLPPHVLSVLVYNENGQLIAEAERKINKQTGRIGYFNKNTGQYVPVFSGFSFEILATADAASTRIQREILAEHLQNYQKPEATDLTVSGKNPVPKNLEILGARIGVSLAERQQRLALEKIAKKYLYIPRKEFTSAEVEGGNLACAKVVTTILKEAGYLDKIILGVDTTVRELLGRGWTQSVDEKPQTGDIIVWGPLLKPQSDDGNDAPLQYATGHKHIGIAVGPNLAINNDSRAKMPVESSIFSGRPVELILVPPKETGSALKERAYLSIAPSSYAETLKRLEKNEPDFLAAVEKIAAKIGCSPDNLKRIFWKECNLNKAAVNKLTGASGLIQFMPETARMLGTSVEAIRKMSATQQLHYVEKYFEPYAGKIYNYQDLYLAVFYPRALGEDDNFVLGSERSDEYARKVYAQNPGIAPKGQGYVTVADFRRYAGSNPPKKATGEV